MVANNEHPYRVVFVSVRLGTEQISPMFVFVENVRLPAQHQHHCPPVCLVGPGVVEGAIIAGASLKSHSSLWPACTANALT
jgi:hypothetical protein